MNDSLDQLYDVEVEDTTLTEVEVPILVKNEPAPSQNTEHIDAALAILPETVDELEQMSPEQITELKKSFLAAVKGEEAPAIPSATGGTEGDTSDNGTLTKELKIELTGAAIVDQGDIITTINSLGGATTYMAEKAKLGEDNIVSYWRAGSELELQAYCLTRMQHPTIMRAARCRVPGTATNIKTITDTAIYHSILVGKHLSQSDRHSLLISSHSTDSKGNDLEPIYYDMEKGEIMEYSALPPDKQGRCFRRFCNSVDGISHVPYIPEEEIDVDLVKEHFELARKEMEEHYENLLIGTNKTTYGIRFKGSVMKWACKDPFLYVDILTLAATPLLVRKPECTFFILGEKGNGKSSFRHLLQCVYGTRNVSGVQVSQMGSWDYASTLLGKSLNFPDEESTNIEAMDKAVFKSMSTHETITIRQKGSSIPFEILCDFPSIIPLNELPNWKNLDGGIARRITILPFNANLMNETQLGGIGYEERTYTPEFISRFLGEIMGIASFYTQTGKSILWSDATKSASNAWANETSNVDLFIQDFKRVFKGFVSQKLLYSCYQNWCRGGLGNVDTGIEYQYETMKRLKEALCVFGGWDTKRTLRLADQSVPIQYTCHHDSNRAKPEEILWERALLDIGAIGGAAWANGRDNVITVAEALDHGWDPVTIRLMSQGLQRRDMEYEEDIATTYQRSKNEEMEKHQFKLMNGDYDG